MTIVTIEDGKLPTPEEIEEVFVNMPSTGGPNPTISQEQLEQIIANNLPAANEPLPEAANDADYLEEIKVTAKKPVDVAALAQALLALFKKGGIGGMIYYEFPPWLQEALQQEVNEQTQENADLDDEVQDALLTPGQNSVLDEIYVTAPAPEGLPPDGFFVETPGLPTVNKVGPYWDAYRERLARMEHVTVTAKRTKTQHIQEITFPWQTIEALPVYKPYPIPNFPGYKPFPESLPEPYPQPAPKKPPGVNPDTDPANRELPGKAPYIQGSIQMTIDPSLGLRLRIARQPARNREENRVRRDRKEERASRAYRTILFFVNKTYGELTELADLWQAIAQNIFVDGKPLYTYSNPAQALLNADDWSVNWMQMAVDYAAMEAQDRAIGKSSQKLREALNDMGYYGPNPGSYMPNLPPPP